MREICLSGSMSGNRNQNQVKPDCGDEAKANSIIHREITVTAPVLDSTRVSTQGPVKEYRRQIPLQVADLVVGEAAQLPMMNSCMLGAVAAAAGNEVRPRRSARKRRVLWCW